MSQGVPALAGRARKRVAACKDGCLLVVFSRGAHMPTTPVTAGQALHGHQGTHIQVPALKTLIPGTPWACQCRAKAPASVVSAPPPSVYLFFFPFSLGCANEYFMARNQREFPRLLPAPSAPAAGTSPYVGGLGGMCLPRRHLRRRGPGQGRKRWLWCGQLCHVPFPGSAVTVPLACEGLASGAWWPRVHARMASMLPVHPCRGVHGCAQVATLARLLPHRCTCPPLSPVCHQPPQPPEGAVSPAHLPVALPRLLGWTGAPLSDRQRQWHRGMHGPWVGPWHPPHGPWHSVGRGMAQALRGLPWAPVPPSWRCPGTAPKPARQAAGMGGREVGDNFAP